MDGSVGVAGASSARVGDGVRPVRRSSLIAVKVAAGLVPGYANAPRDELSEAVPVRDAFYFVGSAPGLRDGVILAARS